MKNARDSDGFIAEALKTRSGDSRKKHSVSLWVSVVNTESHLQTLKLRNLNVLPGGIISQHRCP
jgi:hypothetical protein